MKLFIGADHRGKELENYLFQSLKEAGIDIEMSSIKNNEEDAHHAKNHNGANVISFGGINKEEALNIIKTFLNTKPATEERHIRRINKIIDYENGAYNGL